MVLAPRLDLRQSQSLVMTPQLQQAIKLLQLSNMELAAYVEQELERNPLLERDEGGEEPDTPESPPEPGREVEAPVVDAVPGSDQGALDVEHDNTWTNDSMADGVAWEAAEGYTGGLGEWGGHGGGESGEDGRGFEETLSGARTLRDYLQEQINLAFAEPVERTIAALLMEMLDEAGYLPNGAPEELADRLEVPRERVLGILEVLQVLDPPGIFARTLPECLALQLAERDRLDPCMQALLDNLDLLGRREYARLVRVCGCDSEDLADMVAEIRALDPKPATAFSGEAAQVVTPDVIMRARPDGSWHIELNAESLPRVLVSNRYYSVVSKGARTREERQYLTESLQNANWLVKALHQRAETILKVAGEIVRQQDAFFRHGVSHLRPLILRDVAEAVEMHESTVSRVTSNKYLLSPRGTFELKYFFTQALGGTAGGDTHSAESVRHRIRALIEAETAGSVLSDDKLVAILRGEGVDIARRTVAKYREGMGIPSSVRRRRDKALES